MSNTIILNKNLKFHTFEITLEGERFIVFEDEDEDLIKVNLNDLNIIINTMKEGIEIVKNLMEEFIKGGYE